MASEVVGTIEGPGAQVNYARALSEQTEKLYQLTGDSSWRTAYTLTPEELLASDGKASTTDNIERRIQQSEALIEDLKKTNPDANLKTAEEIRQEFVSMAASLRQAEQSVQARQGLAGIAGEATGTLYGYARDLPTMATAVLSTPAGFAGKSLAALVATGAVTEMGIEAALQLQSKRYREFLEQPMSIGESFSAVMTAGILGGGIAAVPTLYSKAMNAGKRKTAKEAAEFIESLHVDSVFKDQRDASVKMLQENLGFTRAAAEKEFDDLIAKAETGEFIGDPALGPVADDAKTILRQEPEVEETTLEAPEQILQDERIEQARMIAAEGKATPKTIAEYEEAMKGIDAESKTSQALDVALDCALKGIR